MYCTTHGVKVKFWMTEVYKINISTHLFQVNNNEGGRRIGYDIIIGHELVVKFGMTAYFKHNVPEL